MVENTLCSMCADVNKPVVMCVATWDGCRPPQSD